MDTLTVDNDIQSVAVIIDRSNLTGPVDRVLATWTVEMSFNGGPFTFATQGNLWAGESLDDDGLTRINQYWTWTLPPGVNRQARVTVVILERVRTGAELQTFTERNGIPSHPMR